MCLHRMRTQKGMKQPVEAAAASDIAPTSSRSVAVAAVPPPGTPVGGNSSVREKEILGPSLYPPKSRTC